MTQLPARRCERCHEPLVKNEAGFSADGRLVCTRYGCQWVEELNRRVHEGTYTILGLEEAKKQGLIVPTGPLPPLYLKHTPDGIVGHVESDNPPPEEE